MKLSSPFSWATTPRPIIALAPMDGYTDTAMRLLIKEIEPRVICFTEFLSSDYFFYKPKEAAAELNVQTAEQPLIVQMFGKNPEHFAVAAKVAEDAGAAAIDINMGCPAKKIVNSQHGAYLMQNVDLGCEIIAAVRKATTLPLSVKTRLGWQDDSNLIPFIKRLIDSGIDHISIHGRTYSQHFTGKANWEPIYALKEAIPITVIGNGDVNSGQSAKEKLGNLDGVMVGRASFGNPWLFKEIASLLYDGIVWDCKSIPMEERLRVMLHHVELLVASKGEQRAMLECRKHLATYIHGIPGAAAFRSRLVRVTSLSEAAQIIEEIRHAPVTAEVPVPPPPTPVSV